MSKRVPCLIAACLIAVSPVRANTREDRRLEACREVLEEFRGMKESIPRSLIDRAECVAVFPSVKKFAFGFGGRFGRGAVSCRTEEGKGAWGPPLMISMGGGSFGLQIGGQAADLVFLVMNPKGIDYLIKSQFTLGADASVAAGPLGRTGEADTDLRMRAEILSYSRTRGLFAGLSLEGAVVKQDKDGNRNLYGEDVNPKELLLLWSQPMPPAARGFVGLLQDLSPRQVAGE
jgi:SH3 domain-containing YSC84-like protein 1